MRKTALASLAVCGMLTAGTSSAAADDAARPLASIRTAPAVPAEGKPVDLIASSPGLGIRYSWDLDGDGTFDDANGATVRRLLPAGMSTVAVRATDTFGRMSTETRSLTTVDSNFPPVTDLEMDAQLQVDRPEQVFVGGWDQDGRIVKLELDADGDGTYELSNPGTNGWEKEWTYRPDVTYRTPGTRTVRARATDDKGATAVTTTTVHVSDGPPSASLSVYSDTWGHAPVAGQPATLGATSTRPGVHYEFDVDGDGTYEVDNGAGSTLQTSLTAGAHVIGARITDTGGTVYEQRVTTFVYQSADTFADRMYVKRFETSATAGQPIDLTVAVEPYTRAYTVEWDADGDGDFDDGTSTTPGGDSWDSSIGHNTYTYAAPGVYDQRVRVSRPGLPARVFSSRIFVGTRPADRTPGLLLGPFTRGVPYGEEYPIHALGLSYQGPNPTLSWDLDGDGAFDDTPSYHAYAENRFAFDNWWTFTGPTTIAVKATAQTGETTVMTAQLQPPGSNRTPTASLDLSGIAGRPLSASYAIDDDGGARCCEADWDSDGDGSYDDGRGTFPPVTATKGERTVGVRLTDGLNRSAFIRKTFTIGTRPPVVGFHVEGAWLAGGAVDPDGKPVMKLDWDLDGDGVFDDATGEEALAPVGTHHIGLKATDADGDISVAFRDVMAGKPLKLKLKVAKTSLKALLAHGLTVEPGCATTCRATVVLSARKLRGELGKRTGKGKTLRVKLNAKSRKSLRHARSVNVIVSLRASGTGARAGKATRAIKVSR